VKKGLKLLARLDFTFIFISLHAKFRGASQSMSLKDKIDSSRLPQHIAIIMDGNGRWAKERGKNRIFGHSNGVQSVREVSEACAEIGVKYLTLYAFSTENWNRPKLEVTALMELLVQTIRKETKTLMKNNIRLKSIGNLNTLPARCHNELLESMEITANNDRMDLVLALSYSGRDEILQAVKLAAQEVKENKLDPSAITEEYLQQKLFTHNIPDPELLIRTSGEHRVSNFLLWQIAYSEFYFTEKYWPDFRKEDLYAAILDYQGRERRFGKTSEQINP
jgi:undecaprenyl diphosphate synthase